MRRRRLSAGSLALAVVLAVLPLTAGPDAGLFPFKSQDLKEWLSYIASDDLEGRGVFTSGIGLAAAYIEDHLRAWGAKPAGSHGSYRQTVRVLGVKATSHSTVTVEWAGGQTRTFADGEAIILPKNVGGKRRFVVDRVEFAGYGLDAPGARHEDFRGKDVRGAAVIWLGAGGPKGRDVGRRLLTGRHRYAVEQLHAAASIGPELNLRGRGAAAAGGGPGAGPARLPAADFTAAERLDKAVPPAVTAKDEFFEFLFSHAVARYDELKRKAAAQEPLPAFRLDGVKLTFNLDAEYEVVRTRLAQNVVAVVEGSDPQLKNTYVAFGAHYDHLGYAEGEVVQGKSEPRRLGAPGRVTQGATDDRIWNGADDNGSGTVAVMALARAFAEGPRPKRSLLFVWHTGEERGLYGSRYFVAYPTVPLDAIVAHLNVDMIGRNRDNKPSEASTVYPVGSDRISTELHNLNRDANQALSQPLTLDYEFNDPGDPESLYTRSDHYSYAAVGIPTIFFTTGLHPDYHANTDEVSKIEFEKMTRIVQLVYETGLRVANLDHAPARDNRGPRAGKIATTAQK